MTTAENDNGPELEGDCTPNPPPTQRRRRYSRSGFYALRSTLRQLGPRTIDRRTSLGKHLAAWRADLVTDLGGEAALSTQQRALVDVIVRQKLLLESVDAWLLVQPTLVNSRKRTLLPVVRERQALADSLARYLAQLGLERRAKPVPSLDDYLRQRGPHTGAESTGPSPPGSAGPGGETALPEANA
jgi:hypothetical protein